LSHTSGSNVTLFGGSGSNDTLSHTSGSNVTLFGGSGSNDSLSGIGGANVTLFGGSGSNDTLSHQSGSNITLFGGSGSNDSLSTVGESNVTVFGGSGSNDTLSHTSGSNVTLFGGSDSNDSLTSTGGANVTLFGGSGSNDTLSHTSGSNVTLFGGSGSNDSLTGVGGTNVTLFGGSGSNDTLSHTSGSNVTLFGGSGSNDSLSSINESNVSLFGGSGSNDTLSHTSGSNVTLFGGSGGNDSLSGIGGTNVTMIGGPNVTLFTGSGSNDTLTHQSGSNVTLFGGSGSNDSLSSVNESNVTLIGGSGSNDTLSHTSGSNVTLFGGSGSNDSLTGVGGTNVTLFGGSGSNDTLSHTSGTNVTLFGGSGSNDSLSHTSGSNITLFGGSGSNDTLSSHTNVNVTLFGGSGSNDSLSSFGDTNATLFGGSGSNDTLSSQTSHNITLFGGSGSKDSLSSTSGSNVTLFGGSGDNDVLNSTSDQGGALIGGSGSNDTLTSHTSSNVTLFGGSGSNDSLSSVGGANITLAGGSGNNDTLAATSVNNANLWAYGGSFDSLTASQCQNAYLDGGPGNNQTLASSNGFNVTLYGGSGSNDLLTSTGDVNATLVGGTGSNDTLLSPNSTNITLFGGSGNNDSLSSTGDVNATVVGGSGALDKLFALNSSKTTLINGGNFGDLLSGSTGTNTSLFGGGGPDTLVASGNGNIALFGEDGDNTYEIDNPISGALNVTLDDLATQGVEQSPNDRQSLGINTITFKGVNGITLDLTLASGGQSNQVIQQAIATSINLSLIGLFQNVVGTPGNDFIKGNSDHNSLMGVAGNDTLTGGTGPATLVAGAGNDLLIGGSGGTTYQFAGANLGSDTIQQTSPTNNDTVDLSGLTTSASIDLSSAASQVISPNLALSFAQADIANVIGSPFGNTIAGNSRDNQFYLSSGNNTMSGNGGHDMYFFTGTQLGSNTINDSHATNFDTLNFHQFGGPINLDLTKSSQVVNGASVLTLADPQAIIAAIGSDYADSIMGNSLPGGGNTILGGGGSDSIVGGQGNDLLQAGIPQVVFLDFDTATNPGDHIYTQVERDAIQQELQSIYSAFSAGTLYGNIGFVFTQNLSQAQTLSLPTGGQFATLYFNKPPEGGLADEVDGRNQNLGGTASIDVNPILGHSGQPAATSQNYIKESAGIAAHELGHLAGLRHIEASGPPGTGVYEVFVGGQLVAGADPNKFVPTLVEPAGVTPVNGIYSPDGGQTNYNALIFAQETPLHVMGSPASIGTTRFDTLGNIYFGEREAIKLAFDDTGSTINEQSAPHRSFASAQALGSLPGLTVPNTLLPGALNFGKTFSVTAENVVGNVNIDPVTHKSEDDYFSFIGHQGDLMNFQVMSKVLARYAGHQFDTVLKIYDSAGNLIAFNDDEFESQDSLIMDLTLPADGLYYVVVDSFTPDGIVDSQTGNYELFMYSFATIGPNVTPPSSGSTLVAGSGNDVLIGSTGNDVFTFLPGSTGNVTVVGGNGNGPDLGTDVINLTGSPGEHVNVVLPSTIKIIGADADPPHLPATPSQSVTEGGLLRFTVTATDSDLNDRITYSLGNLTNAFGATVNPTTGEVNWVAGDEGIYTIQVIATDLADKTASETVAVTVNDVAPTVNPIPAQSVVEGSSVSLHGSFANPVPGDSYTTSWQVTSNNGQVVSGGNGQDSSFTPLDDGTYTVHFTVTDVDDGNNSTTVTTTIISNEATPVVAGIAPLTVNEGDKVTLAGVFNDPGTLDGFAYNWHVTSTNGQIIADGTNQNFAFTPNDNGSYTVTFTVHDADGGPSGSTTTTVTVNNVPPQATLTNNGPIAEGGTATISFLNAIDPSPIDAASLHYSFALQQNLLATSYGAAGSSATAPFIFAEEGVYSVYGRIFDKDGGFNDYITIVTVMDPSPQVTPGPTFNASEGTAFSNQTLATFTDPGGLESLSDYLATITWGDGQTSAGVISLNGGVFTVTGGHKYSEEGSFIVSVRINHDQSPAVTVTTFATVIDPAMSAAGVVSLTAVEGTTTSSLALATFTDPGGAEALKDYSAAITWGDGKTSVGTISLSSGAFTVSGNHQYAEQGSFSIQVTIGHDSASSAVVTDAIAVNEASLSGSGQSIGVAEGASTGLITVATFVDSGGPESVSDYSATIKWGDSSNSIGTIQPTGDGKTFRVVGSHIYAEEGTDSITVTINHETAVALTVTSTANVSDPAVIGTPTLTNLAQGVNYTNLPVATFVDPGGPESLADYSASINWGDNTTSAGTISVGGGTFTVAGSHTYSTFGSLKVVVNLTHDNSPPTTVTETVAVGPSVIVLNPTQSGALTVSGSSFINVKGDIVVDSNSTSALTIGGTSQITATQILVVGGVSKTGSPILTPTPITGVATAPDPFAALPTPSATGLVNQGSASFSTGTHTLNPGIYTQISVTNGASVILNPGTYVIKGGGLTVSGAGSLSGSGVFVYNAGSSFPNAGGNFGGITISNSGTVSLSPPISGTYANILIFQSRDNNRAISFSGAVVAGFSGEIYAKAALLSLSNSSALKLPVVVDRLTVTGAGTSGLSADGSVTTSDASVGELVQGDLLVYINNADGYFTPDDLARIQDTINNINILLLPYSVTVTEVDASEAVSANVQIDSGSTTPLGGLADGVLGVFTPSTGEITLVQGWKWYAGADPAAIGSDQYDFETLVTHEIGHALGLGHSPDPSSVMFPTLGTGVTRRLLTVQDLNIGDAEMTPGALMASRFEKRGEQKLENSERATVADTTDGSGLSTLGSSSFLISGLNEPRESVDRLFGNRSTASGSFALGSPAGQPGSAIIFSNELSSDRSRSATFLSIFAQCSCPVFFDQNSDGSGGAIAAGGSRTSDGNKLLNCHEVWAEHLADMAIRPLLQVCSPQPNLTGDSTAWPHSTTSSPATSQPSVWDANDYFRGDFLSEDPVLVTLAVLTGTAAIEFRPKRQPERNPRSMISNP
jgi:Ca2+-binding RTX toxin-like protein